MEIKKFSLTKEGEAKLKDELRTLVDTERPRVLEDLSAARAQGDLSENADYDAARSHQAEVEGRIKQIENILANSVIEDLATSSHYVSLGTTVIIRDLTDQEEYTYKIVGTIEARPLEGSISTSSPLGEAILGKRVGDKVVVKTAMPYEVEIVKIRTTR